MTDNPHAEAIRELARYPYMLAGRADCMNPDNGGPDHDAWTAGARWLAGVATQTAEAVEEGRFDERHPGDAMHELADSAVPIYTHERWEVFTDLGAWSYEEAYELGAWEQNDPTNGAAIALYAIAHALIGDLSNPGNLELRTCDECGRIEDAGNAPDWPNGECDDCDPEDDN